MYAKIINEETKEVRVGLGTNTEFYKSIGMIEMEVEKVWDGLWYVKGYAPEKPESIKLKERAKELHKLLDEADYWTSKRADGEYTEEEWAEKVAIRKAWREELRGIEDAVEEAGSGDSTEQRNKED